MMSFNRENNFGCPCKGCTDRVPEPRCHTTCVKYREWRAKIDERNENERKNRQNRDVMSDAKKRDIWRSRRYARQNAGHSSGKE